MRSVLHNVHVCTCSVVFDAVLASRRAVPWSVNWNLQSAKRGHIKKIVSLNACRCSNATLFSNRKECVQQRCWWRTRFLPRSRALGKWWQMWFAPYEVRMRGSGVADQYLESHECLKVFNLLIYTKVTDVKLLNWTSVSAGNVLFEYLQISSICTPLPGSHCCVWGTGYCCTKEMVNGLMQCQLSVCTCIRIH